MMSHHLAEPVAEGDTRRNLRSRVLRALRTLGTAAAVVAVIVLLNIGTVQFYLGQLIVAFLAISAAVAGVRWARRGVRRQARRKLARLIVEYGGGLYGTIAVATWAYLQGMDIYGDIVEAGSLTAFVTSITLGWLIREAIEAFIFAIQASLWPWYWFSAYGFLVPWLVLAGVACADIVRRPVRRWLRARAKQREPRPPASESSEAAGETTAGPAGVNADAPVSAPEPRSARAQRRMTSPWSA